jgi:hypothetical protein
MPDSPVFTCCESCGKRVRLRGDYPVLYIATNSDEWCAGVDRDEDRPPPAPNIPLRAYGPAL